MKKNIVLVILFVTILSIGIYLIRPDDDQNRKSETAEPTDNSAKVLGASSIDQAGDQKNILKGVDIQEAKDLIAQSRPNQPLKIIDIRTNEEFIAGNIEGSTNIDFYGNFEDEIGKLDKNGKYLIYCRSGNRSGQALKVFENLNFKEVYDLLGGYNAWIAQ